MDIDVENLDLGMVCDSLGFEVTPYKYKGRDDTNLVEISRNDKFITIVGKGYKLLPNEVAEAIGKELATRVGAEMVGHYGATEGCENSMIAHYLLDEFEMNGTKARAGFYITNSIDEKMSFRVKSFLKYEDEIIYLGHLVSGIIRKHTKNLEIDMNDIVETAKKSVDKAVEFAWDIMNWKSISVSVGKGIGIVERIRVSGIPNVYRPAYLLKPTKRVKENEIPNTPFGLSLFDMYMDIVFAINHSPVGKLSEKGRILYFNMLHKSLGEIVIENNI